MAKDCVMHQVDVFGLFEALKSNGYAKLSDHFIDDDTKGSGDSAGDPEK